MEKREKIKEIWVKIMFPPHIQNRSFCKSFACWYILSEQSVHTNFIRSSYFCIFCTSPHLPQTIAVIAFSCLVLLVF